MLIRPSPLIALLAAHAGLLLWSAARHSPTLNEPAVLAAGVSHWRLGRFELCRVNPPLVRAAAVLPVLFDGVVTDWDGFYEAPGARPEFQVGADFVAANGERTIGLVTLARWACVPFSLLGALVCHAWASELYGTRAGLLASTLWCFSPMILAHAPLLSADVPCAALGLAASYCFWRWVNRPSWRAAWLAGGVLGVAELTKTTLTVLYPVWAALWLANFCWRRTTRSARERAREAIMLLAIFATSLHVLNCGYLFDGSFTALGDFTFVSDSLSGNASAGRGNRLAGTWLGALRVPLPRDYVLGADVQRRAFEHTETSSYLGGRFQSKGWPYFYFYALAVKVPLGTAGLLLVTIALRSAGIISADSRGAEWFLLTPAVAILALVSSQYGFSQHSRYVLPVLPFMFVWVSQAARIAGRGRLKTAMVISTLLVWSVASSLAVYPHSLSYFNESAGGPSGGHAHLLGSNLDWGQDLLYLRRWLDDHPEAKPLRLSHVGLYDARHLGIDCVDARDHGRPGVASSRSLPPGCYAVSINDLCEWDCQARGQYPSRHHKPPCALSQLAGCRPVARIGYTTYVFHITRP